MRDHVVLVEFGTREANHLSRFRTKEGYVAVGMVKKAESVRGERQDFDHHAFFDTCFHGFADRSAIFGVDVLNDEISLSPENNEYFELFPVVVVTKGNTLGDFEGLDRKSSFRRIKFAD